MKAALLDYYLWIKAVHVIAVIAWMSGLFYLPRLFVYHCETEIGAPDYQRFCTMERKLLAMIMAPAAILTWTMGLTMAWLYDWWFVGWFQLKLALVALMTWVHVTDMFFASDFACGANRRPGRFFRYWNEVPTILMIVTVLLVVAKPV